MPRRTDSSSSMTTISLPPIRFGTFCSMVAAIDCTRVGSAIGTSMVKREPLPTVERSRSGMAEQLDDAPYRREPEPEAARAIARGIVELIELLEDALVLLGRDADAGIPDLDLRNVAAPAAGDQDAAVLRVAQRVRRRDSTARGTAASRPSPASPSSGAPSASDPCPARARRMCRASDRTPRRPARSRASLRPVRHRASRCRAGCRTAARAIRCTAGSGRSACLARPACRVVAQRRCEQSERVQRLTQIVIGGREEQRFRAARFFGADARLFGERVLALAAARPAARSRSAGESARPRRAPGDRRTAARSRARRSTSRRAPRCRSRRA